ncbi:ArnT family glycosyltransferase [Embleya sp. NPDC059237]|uniref:ArnT family glycosyltransferase n=1 Tax=Embleya sp. NPDC059237 TaxID=3346784 RepID=UPI00367EF842
MSRVEKGTSTEPLLPAPAPPALPPLAKRPIVLIMVAVFALQAAVSARYGFHRDELYFVVAGRHLAWGYVDQPPLTPLLARASGELFGDDPQDLRIFAALACAGTVLLVALIAREFGSGRAGQLLAAACAATSGIVLGIGHLWSTATLDIVAWLLIAWFVLRLLRTGDGRWWLAVGAAVGFAMLNKYLVGYLVVALLVGLFAVGPREVLRSRWLVGGVAIAIGLSAPGLWWQATHDWPQFTVAGGISTDDGIKNRIMFVPLQIAYLSPLFVPIWVAGARRLLRAPQIDWARSIVPGYAVLCVLVIASGGKSYYALPLLLVLVAAGCEPTVQWAASRPGRRVPVGSMLLVATVTSAVISLPLLPAGRVNAVIGINPEQGEQIGWPELADAAAVAWGRIPPDQRGRAVLFAGNYGEAGALDRYGPARGLPKPYSGHMSFADWGPPPDRADGPVVVVREGEVTARYRDFVDCRLVTRVDNGKGVDNEEQHAVVELCAGTTKPWSRIWPDLRHFY